ncbi:unnamed protein product [Urochloa humidicola]
MPETDEFIEMESTDTGALQEQSIVPMEVQGSQSQSQPSQVQGEATNQVVVDLEEGRDTGTEKARKQMEPRSDVWKHFIKLKDDKGFLV